MSLLMLKELPRYDALMRAAERFPALEPSACAAYFNLLRTGDDVIGVVRRFLASREIAQGRFTVLALLGMGCLETPATPAELADAAGVTRATMTGLIDTLEKDRMVKRAHDPKDRRNIRVQLTKAGRAALDGILPDYFRCVADILRPLSEKERGRLIRLLQKIQAGIPEAKTR